MTSSFRKFARSPDVGVDDPGFHVQHERIRLVEGGVVVAGSARHLPAKPAHVNAKAAGSLAQHQIVRINRGGSGSGDGSIGRIPGNHSHGGGIGWRPRRDSALARHNHQRRESQLQVRDQCPDTRRARILSAKPKAPMTVKTLGQFEGIKLPTSRSKKRSTLATQPEILIFDVDGVLVDVRGTYWRYGAGNGPPSERPPGDLCRAASLESQARLQRRLAHDRRLGHVRSVRRRLMRRRARRSTIFTGAIGEPAGKRAQ